MSSRLATDRRKRPVLSFHWTSTMSAHSIRGSMRLSSIYFLIGEQKAKDYEGPCDKTPYSNVRAHPPTRYCQGTTLAAGYTILAPHGTAGSGNTFHCVGFRNSSALVQRFYVLRPQDTPSICPSGGAVRSSRKRGIGRGACEIDHRGSEQDLTSGGVRLGGFDFDPDHRASD